MRDTKDENLTEFSIQIQRNDRSESREKDDFWDIDMLLPRRKTPPRRAEGATEPTEILIEPIGNCANTEKDGEIGDSPLNLNPAEGEVVVRHFVPPHTQSSAMTTFDRSPIISYESDEGLIHRVKVYPWSSRYHYYRDFTADAVRYLSREPKKDVLYDKPIRYFSYVPQYSQLTDEQLEYYFYWRREFRKGNTVEIDDSYLYLYIYEILNTAGYETDSEEGLRMLYRLFFTYGKENPRLSHLLSEWIVDYSLIFQLSVPDDVRSSSDFHRTYASTLKEFYISAKGSAIERYAEILIRYASAYDYRKSHFYKGENCAYFDRYLKGALGAVIQQYSRGDHLFVKAGMKDSHMVRNAFEEALCSHRIRYRIEIDYASFSRSNEIRYFVSDVLKYTENRLRAFLGIKSRLTVYSLSTDVRQCIDRYCDESFPQRNGAESSRKDSERPSYEKLYDLPKAPLSVVRAAEIEEESWETTERLIEAFSEGENEPEGISFVQGTESDTLHTTTEMGSEENGEVNGLPSILGSLYPYAYAVYAGDRVAAKRIVMECGKVEEMIIDEINERVSDALGDILILESDEWYCVIEEYRSFFNENAAEEGDKEDT